MLTLEKMAEKTSSLIQNGIEIPKVPIQTQDEIDAYHRNGLYYQAKKLSHEIRLQQAKDAGFEQVYALQMAKMLIPGYKNYKEYAPTDFTFPVHTYYLYDNISDEIKTTANLQCPHVVAYNGFFGTRKQFSFGCLGDLKNYIPHGVVLTVEEIKKLKFFNTFIAFAPVEQFISKPPVQDPIVVGVIGNVSTDRTISDPSFYFIAKW